MEDNKNIIKIDNDDNGIVIDENVVKIEELQNKLDESENKYKYLLADLSNIKKRYEQTINDIKKYEGENIFKQIIEFIDYLDLKIKNNESDRIYDIKDKMIKLLKIFDVKPIYDERPAYFNDKYDEAISSVNVNDKNLNNTIYDVYQPGYLFKDKILRYEKVIVNKYINNKEND